MASSYKLFEWHNVCVSWGVLVIFGAHIVLASTDAEADRVFLRNVLGFAAVDAGHGWLIFALPPAEAAIHPAETNSSHELYLMCDNLTTEIATLTRKNLACAQMEKTRWGSICYISLPGGGRIDSTSPNILLLSSSELKLPKQCIHAA